MLENNSTENVFRFVQIRPPVPADSTITVVIPAEIPLVSQLAGRSSAERTRIANEYLRAHAAEWTGILNSTEGQRAGAAIRQFSGEGSVKEFRTAFGNEGGALAAVRKHFGNLAGLLVAAKFANTGVPRETNAAARLYRAFAALLQADSAESGDVRLYDYLRRPIALPEAFSSPRTTLTAPVPAVAPVPATTLTGAAAATPAERTQKAARMQAAIEDLAVLTRPELLHIPRAVEVSTTNRPTAFGLNAVGAAQISADTRSVLADLGLDPVRQPITEVLKAIETRVAATAQPSRLVPAIGPTLPQIPGPQPSQPLVRPYLKSAGVADLLIVKQHLVRYDRVDIAHVENVLIGEKKSRTHRALERVEDTSLTEKETLREKETELQTDERFELQRETSITAKEDQQFGFQLSLSGKYGPSVEFSSNAELDSSTSTEETTRTSTNYAKDIMARSLERVTERVRQQQQRTVLREMEETNLHELANGTGAHVIGTYQFLEKVYQSQVFNYGVRQMFDFMIPEPASYLWFLENAPATELDLPDPPTKLESLAANAWAITPYNYLDLAAKFGAEGLSGPPPLIVTAAASLKSGEGGDEEGQPRSIIDKEITVPAGYVPFSAMVRPIALTDDQLTIAITVGSSQIVWKPRNAPEVTPVGSDHSVASADPIILYLGGFVHQGTIPVQALAFETNTFGLTVDVIFQRTTDAFEAWQIKTYDAIASAYKNAVQKYEQDVAERRARAEAEAARNITSSRFGAPPSQNLKIILEELKKHCISIVTRQRYEMFNATNDGAPPIFDFDQAADQGQFTRFFEQAFEWDQMQYVFYPYFWARQKMWSDRFHREEVDPVLQDFLRAGAARVVAPVRPGFEVSVTHYLETGILWDGLGNPPEINSPLYVPIVTEIKERTGAGQGEVPVGNPWFTHMPTPLVTLRREDNLPQWERSDPDAWEWQEKQPS